MYCRHCGKKISDDSLYCEYCGEQVMNDNSQEIVIETVNSDKMGKCVVCGRVIECNEPQILLETGEQICKECNLAFSGEVVAKSIDEKEPLDDDILTVLNNKEDYTYRKLKDTLSWLHNNGYIDEAHDLEKYINNLEKEEERENSKSESNIAMILGIVLFILGMAAMFFCIIRINNDMTPVGLYGIRANYEPPFNSYEKQQITKLVLSIVCWFVGVIMWVSGRRK